MEELGNCRLKKNDLFELSIDALGNEGEGIGHLEGFAFFVKGAVPGDKIQARVLKIKRNYGYARIEQVLTPSPDRVAPRCPVAGPCGGCQLQHLSYEKQLKYKQQKIEDCLQRIGGITNPKLEPIIGMEEPYYYRNKAQFPVGKGKDGKTAIGFYAGRTHTIIDSTHCCIQARVNEALIAAVREYLDECRIEPYNEIQHTGLVRNILTRVGFVTGEIMVCMVINGTSLPKSEILKEKLIYAVEEWNRKEKKHWKKNSDWRKNREEKEQNLIDNNLKKESINIDNIQYKLTSLCLNINTEKTNVILGKKVVPLYGETYITDFIGSIKYQISPLSFYQVNPVQTRLLYEQALAYADLKGGEIVWDLYCGIGTISLFLAQKAKQVYGVEIVPQAIDDARKNAELNKIINAEFFAGAAEEILPQQYEKSGGAMRADVIVVDPPRKGCDEGLLATIVKMQPNKVVYVSCDPATLARDVKYLRENGFEFVKGRGVDQFGMGGHVEAIVGLQRRDI